MLAYWEPKLYIVRDRELLMYVDVIYNIKGEG